MQNLTDIRDRTSEFFQTVQLLAKQQQINTTTTTPNSSSRNSSTLLSPPTRSSIPSSYPTQSNYSNEFDDIPVDTQSLLAQQNNNKIPSQRTGIALLAKEIGNGIQGVTIKLEQLTKCKSQRKLIKNMKPKSFAMKQRKPAVHGQFRFQLLVHTFPY